MKNLKLRSWQITDLDNLVKYANNWNIAKYLTDKFPFPYTESDGRSFIDYANNGDRHQIFAIEVNNEAVGGIGIHLQDDVFRKNAEIGYWLAELFWNKGIMSKAISKTVQFAFDNFDIERIYARPFGTNIASQKCLEKCGFTLEAKLDKTLFKDGRYLDEMIYAIRR